MRNNDYDKDNDEEEIMPEQFISTTANGDGLEFDKRLGSIFDEIQRIKDQDMKGGVLGIQEEDLGFKIEDVPSNLSPLSVLLEVSQTLEQIKQDIMLSNQKEDEYANVLKSIKFGDYVEKSSETLALMLNKYQSFAQENDEIRQKLDTIQQEKFKVEQDLNILRIDKNLMQQNIVDLDNQLQLYIEQNKRLKTQVDYMRRQREEQINMQEEENRKVILDTQTSKDKIERLKVELYDLKKKFKKIENFKMLYEDLKQRDSERQSIEIQEKTFKELKRIKEMRSLIGHLKIAKQQSNIHNSPSNNLSLIEVSPFSNGTFQFLHIKDVLNLTSLSRRVSGVFLKNNSRVFIHLMNRRAFELNQKYQEVSEKCEVQQFVIKRNETRDQIRQMMASDTGDEKIRHIIDKHVVQPHLKQLHAQNQNIDIASTSGKVTLEVERALKIATEFMAQYLEQLKAYQLHEIKVKQDQQRQLLLQQQQEAEKRIKQEQKLKKEQDKLNESVDGQKPKKEGYKIVKAGKKMFGALSYFSGYKSSASKNLPEEQKLEEQKVEEISTEQIEQDAQIQEQSNESENQVIQNESSNSQIQESLKDEKQGEILQQQINELSSAQTIADDGSQQLSEESKQNPQNFSIQISEQHVSVEGDQMIQDSSLQNIDQNQAMQQQSAVPQPNFDDLVAQEETIKTLDQIKDPEEMNDFLVKIGGFLLSDKGKLTQWIRGVQQGFAQFYVLAKSLYIESRELEILRDFLVLRVENMKLRIEDLLNQKEDMAAIHSSDSTVKEHLIQKMNELDKLNMERTTELLFEKKKAQELESEKKEFDEKFEKSQKELNDFKQKVSREVKVLRERVGKLTDENVIYQKTIEEMKIFFNKVNML
ncbi:UNKNOWN [Stylonychia lemnae]|uniref:Uncharacterized protein n=1 Tax=Stylonychia lemnae TaxID=5949 RepID=A0A078A9P8_STYLE|nr:UNKNOWN [Stylonychia lemnae]|eukprot:CDW79000.1 UNKNOWN [Stylonychia lemnae]